MIFNVRTLLFLCAVFLFALKATTELEKFTQHATCAVDLHSNTGFLNCLCTRCFNFVYEVTAVIIAII